MSRHPHPAKRLDASDGGPIDLLAFELVPTTTLRPGDLVLCTSGDVPVGLTVLGVARLGADGAVCAGHVVVRVP